MTDVELKRFDEKVNNIKMPTFDVPPLLSEAITDLISCLKNHNFIHQDVCEDEVLSRARMIPDEGKERWVIKYYANRGWLKGDIDDKFQ